MKNEVTVIGGGLAGSEIALQLAGRGIGVRLVEMRPAEPTPVHRTSYLAELVCSNSLKSENPETASGLLKMELRRLKCRLLGIAEKARVPAGHALAVDREEFARLVTVAVDSESRISMERSTQNDLSMAGCSVVATGPLTSPSLSDSIRKHFSREHLYFYDAISISVHADSVDTDIAFKASRYGKGGADYWNLPFSKEEYGRFVSYLRDAPKVQPHGFEETRCFEACLPVEVIAARGEDTLRFGPLKPKGLPDPSTGREPYAVLQLRQETSDGSLLGLVGFQTRLTRHAQKGLLACIPGLEGAEILRWGSIHRNTYINSPLVLDSSQMSTKEKGLFFSGQIVGVEGYMESIAHGLITSINVSRHLAGKGAVLFPKETLIGALQGYLSASKDPYQPMNVNFGLLPPVGGKKRERKKLMAERSLEALERFLSVLSCGQ